MCKGNQLTFNELSKGPMDGVAEVGEEVVANVEFILNNSQQLCKMLSVFVCGAWSLVRGDR